jgi:transposase
MSYKIGRDRKSKGELPDSLEDWISSENEVRLIDAFVKWLDLSSLGFDTTTQVLGSTMYPPGVLLKLYIYGYLNRIRSSRRLALECTRNIELFWLLEQLTPQYHTISDFRKDNSVALKGVFQSFTQFCMEQLLVGGEKVAIDGTKIHAQNNQKNNYNAARLTKLLARITSKTAKYEGYLQELNEADTQADAQDTLLDAAIVLAEGKSKALVESKLAELAARRVVYEGYQKTLQDLLEAGCTTEELQISTVDEEARSMSFKQHHTEVGYNIQTVGDAKHSLIVHFEVTNVGDNNALADIAIATKAILQVETPNTLDVLADAGYHTGSQLAKCADNGILTYVCPPEAATIADKDPSVQTFTKSDFVYNEKTDTYTCPNRLQLTTNGTWYEHRRGKRRKSWNYKQYTLPSKTCLSCPFAAQCQGNRHKNSHGRIIERTEFDDAVEANKKRMAQNPTAYQQRKEVIEHPFGTIKRSWGYHYTLVKTKKKVSGEFAIIFLCYNLRRVINILGVNAFKNALNTHFYSFLTACNPTTAFSLFYTKKVRCFFTEIDPTVTPYYAFIPSFLTLLFVF